MTRRSPSPWWLLGLVGVAIVGGELLLSGAMVAGAQRASVAALGGGSDLVAAPAPVAPAAPDEQQRSLEWAEKRAAELGGGVRPEDVMGPHEVKADLFNPDGPAQPALGGRVIVHLEAHPKNLNYAIENSAVVTFMLYELHDSLLDFNWETWRNDLELAEGMQVEDTLVLKGGRGANDENIVFGKVVEDGDHYVVTSGSTWNKVAEKRVPKADVESLQRATVYTFELRPGVTWHDGHPFDAQDVLFSTELYQNPTVDCDEKRFQFEEIVRGEVLDPLVVRFFLKTQYFLSESLFNSTLCILPRHLYDLTDPDCKDFKEDATPEERGTYINDNPHNIQWVGLGPYKLKEWAANQYLEGVRFEDYWQKDPSQRGYVDTIRWRYVDNDDSAFQALLNDELDIFRRVKTEDYFGEATSQKLFTDKFYKAYSYTGQYGYTCWNLYRKKFADVNVRKALGHAFDSRGWVANKYQGLAVPVTGPAFFLSPFYNQDVPVLDYDPAKAEEMLAEAGWYDRNGDGTIDKDGEEMVIEFLMPSGNKASESMGQKLQESYAKIGVGVKVQPLEWASFLERMLDRDFDCCNLAWVLYEPESDPKQIWHSSEAGLEQRSSNHAGYKDPESDRLIDALRIEPDVNKRIPLWHQLHARIYDLQPYLFGQTPPTKYAFSRKLHGMKLYNIAPGYRVRDLYFAAGTPGTRPLY